MFTVTSCVDLARDNMIISQLHFYQITNEELDTLHGAGSLALM
jgi:hypothetical protein